MIEILAHDKVKSIKLKVKPRVTVFIVLGVHRIWQKTDWSNGTSYYYCLNLLLLIFSNRNSGEVAFPVKRSSITKTKVFTHVRQKFSLLV